MKAYWEEKKELFQGLAIEKLEDGSFRCCKAQKAVNAINERMQQAAPEE